MVPTFNPDYHSNDDLNSLFIFYIFIFFSRSGSFLFLMFCNDIGNNRSFQTKGLGILFGDLLNLDNIQTGRRCPEM